MDSKFYSNTVRNFHLTYYAYFKHFQALSHFTAVWTIQRNSNRRQQLQGDRQNNMGYIRDPLIDIEPNSCPPDLLHMKKGVLTKMVNQVVSLIKYCFPHFLDIILMPCNIFYSDSIMLYRSVLG